MQNPVRFAALLSIGLLAACAAPADRADAAQDEAMRLNPFGAYLAGRHAQQQRDYGAAADFFDHALRRDPDDFDLMNRTFRLELSEGEWDKVGALAPKILEREPHDPLAGLFVSLEAVRRGDFAAADREATDLPEEGLHRLATPLVQAWIKLGLGRYQEAAKELAPLGEIRGLGVLRDLHWGAIADLAGDAGTAAEKYEAVLKAGSRLSWRAADLVGNFYARNGRREDANALYQRFAAESPGTDQAEAALARAKASGTPAPRIPTPRDGAAEALFDLASVVNQSETLDLALLYGRLALFLKPDFALAQLLVADVLAAQQRPEAALALNRAVDPSSSYGWTARLRIAANLQALDRTEEAIAALRAMAAERPDRVQPLVELGDLLRQKQRYAEAAQAYDDAIARIGSPETRHWSLFYSRGIARERAGQWPQAEADLKRALELQPDQPLVLNYLGYSWVDKGMHLAEAFRMIERAVQLRPNDGYIVDSLGWAHYRRGEYDQATRWLEQAVELRPQDPTINDHLGDAYWRTGRRAEARAQWERALLFKPEPDEAKAIQSKLENGLGPPPPPPPPSTARGGG
jgi:tetratricopeptide (TPR) repeat protein